ncbi:hypothetical protein DPMN_075309 [Dreissena polymorpha]|uniref:RRM domain-containing protein n=1 Tax=Dreissena polymorpha TaxID=45954 RepID=A0A9D3YLF2_DREPO|nr:hypothetical protein DPMN_075309 [Dreissena polymorpha]
MLDSVESYKGFNKRIKRMPILLSRSRGFGFVTYQELSMVEDCMACRPHVVDGRTVDSKRAMPKVVSHKLV